MNSSISTVTKTIEKISKDQNLGIRFEKNDLEECGIRIHEILPDSPSAVAGLEAEDRIISINGKSAENSSAPEIIKMLKGANAGAVAIVIERDGMNSSISTVTKTIEKIKDQSLGIRFETNELEESGIRICEILPDSPSAVAGLEAGDRIISINGKSAENSSAPEIVKMLKGANAGAVAIVIERDDHSLQDATPIINAVLKRESADEAFGLHLMQSSDSNKVIIRQLEGPASTSISTLKSGDCIVSINGFKVTNVDEGNSLIKECDTTELIVNVYRHKSFKQLVEQEFSREFFITWTDSNVCIIARKDNPTPSASCCCVFARRGISYTLTLRRGGQVSWMEGSEQKQSQQKLGAGLETVSKNVGVAAGMTVSILAMAALAATDAEVGHSEFSSESEGFLKGLETLRRNSALAHKLSRIESQLMVHTNGFQLAVFAATTAPQRESMVRVDDDKPTVADEIAKLKAMLDSRTINNEEFQQAKRKVLLS